MYKPRYLAPYELVDKATYTRMQGNESRIYRLFNPRLLKLVDYLRMNFNSPVTINNWYDGGTLDSRGLRLYNNGQTASNIYSQHCSGNALDFSFDGITTKEVHDFLRANWYTIQTEIGIDSLYVEEYHNGKLITWIHCHLFQNDDKKGLVFFNV